MTTQIVEATAVTPKITLDPSKNYFSFEGESYPEDVNAFYDPIIKPLETYLKNSEGKAFEFDFFLTYFNSASTKVFFNLFNLLEDVTEMNSVTVNWKHYEEDDTAEEFGHDFKEDLVNVCFNFITL